MDELVVWLRAQLDEDERIAREAGGDDWRQRGHPSETVAVYDSNGAPVVYDEGAPSDEQQEHIATHDPARVLREIDAKRRIIGRINSHAAVMGWDEVHGDLLRSLALPYADRPGYREEWRL
jgi:hypothetical protein